MSTNKNEVIAAIDVGSNTIRMKIAEIKSNGKIAVFEDLRQPINLGRDTFSMGIIETETIQKTCEILKDYKRFMKEYKIKTYKAVSTSAVREAENRDYILDQIKVKTGLDIDVINNAQERFLTYKGISDKIDDYTRYRKEGMLIVDIGSGGVEASLYKNGYLNFTENIKVGSLRLREILHDLERKTLNFPEIMEEFVESKIYLLLPRIKRYNIKHFVGLGGEIKIISMLCNNKAGDVVKINKSALDELYMKLKSMTTQSIMHGFGISPERAEVLLPSVIVFRKFLEATDTEVILSPLVSLRDGLISDIVDTKFKSKRKTEFVEDIISSSRCLAEKYEYDEAHARHVEKISLELFDNTTSLHGMGDKERFYLQMASVLHDIGKFISHNNHSLNSYNIIQNSNIIGLSERDLKIIAKVVKYHSEDSPGNHEANYRMMDYADRLIVSKLCAILKLADSLDISHKQYVKNLSVELDEDLLVKISTDKDITLEQWTFENKSDFFYEVFGIRPIIRKKVRINNG
ncbi:MAG: HD domain-containing protein [Bacillota bacterium]